ncbi:DMT family transporter [Rhodobacteraceae bacterium NNCM2]|nr:DMT family transporter [Coraliihabitans acroporae]
MPVGGIAAALGTVLIWASFLVSLRFAMTSSYSPGAVLMMRFLPAAIILSPIIWRTGLFPKGVPFWQVLLIVLGSGVPFYFLVSMALQYAPASDAGALAPGTLPLMIAAASFFVLGERFSRFRLAGFALILTGGLMIGLWEALTAAGEGVWRGHLMILTAVSCWAVYTVVFRISGLGALEGAALSISWSSILVVPLGFALGVSTGEAEWSEIGVIIFIQGVLGGAVALISFGLAVRMLGPSRTAAFTALTPVLVLVSSVLLLGESIDPVKIAGIVVVSTGVFLASGVLESRA